MGIDYSQTLAEDRTYGSNTSSNLWGVRPESRGGSTL